MQSFSVKLLSLVFELPILRKIKESVCNPGRPSIVMIENGDTGSSPPPMPQEVANIPTDIEKLAKSLIEHEGMELKMYNCPAGYKTIGVGIIQLRFIDFRKTYCYASLARIWVYPHARCW